MQYEWIKNVAKISDDCMSIIFFDSFNQKIEPNSLPENLTNLTFGWDFNQIIELNSLPENLTTLIFGYEFNQLIEPNSLPENLTTIIFGWEFNQKIEPNILPENLTTLIFGNDFNQKIEPNTLPENLKTLTFGFCFNHKIESILNNVKYINFDCRTCINHLKLNITKINNIPKYFNVKIYVNNNFYDGRPKWPIHVVDYNECGPKWPIHVVDYNESKWLSDVYEIIDKYIDPTYGDITVLINKEVYEPYSHVKSARN